MIIVCIYFSDYLLRVLGEKQHFDLASKGVILISSPMGNIWGHFVLGVEVQFYLVYFERFFFNTQESIFLFMMFPYLTSVISVSDSTEIRSVK